MIAGAAAPLEVEDEAIGEVTLAAEIEYRSETPLVMARGKKLAAASDPVATIVVDEVVGDPSAV